jgi:hypothetical protein
MVELHTETASMPLGLYEYQDLCWAVAVSAQSALTFMRAADLTEESDPATLVRLADDAQFTMTWEGRSRQPEKRLRMLSGAAREQIRLRVRPGA